MFGFNPNTVFVRSTFAQRLDVRDILTGPVHAFLVQLAPSPLPLHAVFVLTPLQLLLILLLVRALLLHVRHLRAPPGIRS